MSLQALSNGLSNWLFLALVAGIPLFGFSRKINVYDAFIDGAKEGFSIVLKIVPYLVAMLVAIGMFRASGAFEYIAASLAPVLTKIGMPADVLPLALLRPFSGAGSTGIMADVINTHGGDAYPSKLAATIMGGTETTFYVVAVYFGAVGIRRTRHAIPVGLLADFVGVAAALWICWLVFLR